MLYPLSYQRRGVLQCTGRLGAACRESYGAFHAAVVCGYRPRSTASDGRRPSALVDASGSQIVDRALSALIDLSGERWPEFCAAVAEVLGG